MQNEVGGFNTADEIVEYLRSLGKYDVDINGLADSKGFSLIRRCVKTFEVDSARKY